MMDYHVFWLGFVVLFGMLPGAVGAGVGLIWAWRGGRRGARLILPILLGGAGLGLAVLIGAILLFRA